MRLRRGEVQVARIDRTAADHAFDAFGFHFAQRVDIAHVRQAAARDHGNLHRARKAHRRLDVDALKHAVATDVRVDDRLAAVVLELAREVRNFVARQLAPAVGGDLAVLRIEPDDDMAAERRARFEQEAGVLHRRRADDHVLEAVVQIAFDRVQVADAAAQLHGNLAADFFDDRANRVFVLRLAGERAVQVDEVQAPRAAVDPMSGHYRRFLVENRRLVHIALFEAYTLTVFQVDGGDQQHSNRVLSGKKLKFGWRQIRPGPGPAPGRSASLVHVFRRPCRRASNA
ncbi:hypothetical protein BCAR13_260050 [Paraburkholderia caribensis]|nr:hypothetical protein BCAR13_260050 [Paraburkholderia caribensis]